MIRFMMCPDHLSAAQLPSAFDGGCDFTITTAQGRNGLKAFQSPGGVATASKLCATGGVNWAQTTLFMAQASKAAEGNIFRFRDGANAQVSVSIDSDRRLVFWRGEVTVGTIIAQTSIGAVPNTPAYPHIAVKVKVDPTVGTVACRIDGVQMALFTSGGVSLGTEATALNTRTSGVTQISLVEWRSNNYAVDLMVWDTTGSVNNDWLGDKAVIYSPVTGNGGENDSTIAGSTPAATRWEGVDETPADDDVSYNTYASAGQKQLYTWAGIPTSRRGVVALAPVNRWRKDDAGSNIMRSLLRPSTGADEEGYDVSLTTSYGDYLGEIFETNPVTSAAWQPGDAPQIGGTRNT